MLINIEAGKQGVHEKLSHVVPKWNISLVTPSELLLAQPSVDAMSFDLLTRVLGYQPVVRND